MIPEFCWSMFQHLRIETRISSTLTHFQPKYRTMQPRQIPRRFSQNVRRLHMLTRTSGAVRNILFKAVEASLLLRWSAIATHAAQRAFAASLLDLDHPLVRIRSHVPPIIPAFYSRKLLKIACPVHSWESHASSSKRLPVQHSTDPAFTWKAHVEKRRFQPTFSCGIRQPFLAHADFKYAEFCAMDHASKSRLELQPRIGSYVGNGYQICPYRQFRCSGDQLQNKQLVSRWHRKILFCF